MAKASLYTAEMIEKYTREGYWENINFPDIWDRNARQYPDKEAVVDSRNRLTWSEAKTLIDRLALGLVELGVKRDEVVVFQLPPCVESALLRVACEKAGLLHLCALRTLRHTEMAHVLGFTEARAIIMPWKYRGFDHLDMVNELKPNLPHLKHIIIWGEEAPKGTLSLQTLLSTSLEKKYPADYLDSRRMSPQEFSMIGLTTGSTGLPKFVESPICSLTVVVKGNPRLKLNSNDVIPVTTGAALGPTIPALYMGIHVGARIVLLENWTVEEGLKMIEKERATLLSFVPTQFTELMAFPDLKKYNLNSVRAARSTGAALPYQLAIEVEEKLHCHIQNVYGSVDYGGISTPSIDDPPQVRHLTCGSPLPGNEIQLRDPSGKEVEKGGIGEIYVRGPYGASGYYKDPEMTAKLWDKDGWYRTGDLGKLEGGNLIIAGREKDMIIRGGQNIYPLEIENLLLANPKVADVAVVGIPDNLMGERTCACIVLKHSQAFSFEEMAAYLKNKRIAAYKLPEKLLIFSSLPYIGGLKLDKKIIRSQAVERLKIS